MRWRALATCLLLTGSGAGVALVEACGTSTAPAADAGVDAVAVCLTNVEQENGAPCDAPDGYSCPVELSCSSPDFYQQANCVCATGKWQCSYAATGLDGALGGVITPDAALSCMSGSYSDSSACPTSEVEATQGGPEGGPMPCALANAGLSCNYDSGVTCPDAAFPNIDTCECVSGPDAGLVFSCEGLVCDTAPPDAALDDSITTATDVSGSDAATGED